MFLQKYIPVTHMFYTIFSPPLPNKKKEDAIEKFSILVGIIFLLDIRHLYQLQIIILNISN